MAAKYAGNHSNRFKYPLIAFFLVIVQATVVLLIELANIINLVNITDLLEMVMNFVALGIVAEFDDFFVKIYK